MVSKNSRNGLILSPALMGTVLIFTVFSSHVSSSAADAISLCAASVVPSLFPFMVLSSLAVSAAFRVKYPTVRWTVIILLGLLCGLPVGSGAVGRERSRSSLQQRLQQRQITLPQSVVQSILWQRTLTYKHMGLKMDKQNKVMHLLPQQEPNQLQM